MWGTPVLSEGGVRNPMANTLFSSSFSIRSTALRFFMPQKYAF